jgi:hypothetical protein
VFWTYPTPRELAGHLATLLEPEVPDAGADSEDAAPAEADDAGIAAVLAAAMEEA